MKKKYIIGPLIVLGLIVGLLFFKDMIKKNIIVLKDGNTISANKTWQVGDKIFYKNTCQAVKDHSDAQAQDHGDQEFETNDFNGLIAA